RPARRRAHRFAGGGMRRWSLFMICWAALGAHPLTAQERAAQRADSAVRDSAGRADSTPADTTRRRRRKPAPAAAETLATPVPPPPGTCAPPDQRASAATPWRFDGPDARRPVALATPVLRDPTLRGPATLAFEVDTLGRVDTATVRITDGDPYLLPTARASAARWRFRPALLLEGCPVRARASRTVQF
ncbi:MAG TPA: energy transducer TonB, partial [Gemmatimonadales bacterium]|nr:energy transducer TonB [Gemmatimonadales bacterium]